MDPTANLIEQLKLAGDMIDAYHQGENGIDQDDANRLAELVVALSAWICKGGSLPIGWRDCGGCAGHGGSCIHCNGTGKEVR